MINATVGILSLRHLYKWICSLLHRKASFLDDSNSLHFVKPWSQISFFATSEWKKLVIPPMIVKWKTLRSLRAICSSRVLRLWDLSTTLQVKALQTKPSICSRSPPPNVVGMSACKCHTRTQLSYEMPLFSIPVQGSSVHGDTPPRILEPTWKEEDEDGALDQVSLLKKQGGEVHTQGSVKQWPLWPLILAPEQEVELAWP